MTTTTKTTIPAEKLQAILADAKEYTAAKQQEAKIRKTMATLQGRIVEKQAELAKARKAAATTTKKALAGVGALVVGEDDAAPERTDPSIAELQDDLRDLGNDLDRHREALPRQVAVIRRLAEPVAETVREEFVPLHQAAQARVIKAVEDLTPAAEEMAAIYRALADAGSSAVLHGIGPPDLARLHWWVGEAKKDQP